MQNGKPTILMMSDCPALHTGQAVVLREVALGLHNTGKYNIVVAAWGYNGFPHNFPFTMIPASARDFGRTGFPEAGIPGIEQIIEMVKPEVLWTIGDCWMVNYIADLKNRKNFKWVAYTPVDGTPVMDYWLPWLKNMDQLVMESQYGVDEVIKAGLGETPFIYHGCNIENFKPLGIEAKKEIKQNISWVGIRDRNNLFVGKGLPEDAFIVGTVARNQPRKNFDKILKSFKIFAEDKPNARLWLHTAPVDQGYNIPQLAEVMGIKDKVLFTPNYSIANGLSEKDLNVLMNIFDVHLLPTQGEGFGIPILETMAAGIPQVVTDYTSHVEFAKFGGLMIPVTDHDDFITGMPHPVERAIPKPTETAKLIQQLHDDADLRDKLSKGARAKAETMTWAATIPQWDKIMTNVINGQAKTNIASVEVMKF
jgi:glycosyltransferase involved in cell wall biosynthesis